MNLHFQKLIPTALFLSVSIHSVTAQQLRGGCAQDMKQCPLGPPVNRDPKNNCNFRPCAVVDCTADVKKCEDGSYLSRDPKDNCEFPACPSFKACTRDQKECGDGSLVGRDPYNNCEFEECPLIMCPTDVKTCEDGTFVSRDPNNNCQFKSCPVAIKYPTCTEVEGLDQTCFSCCSKAFKSYRDDKCGDDMECHDVNVPTFLKCEGKCLHSCENSCILQDTTCVQNCNKKSSNEEHNSCLAECNDWWWNCTGNCKVERLADRETSGLTRTTPATINIDANVFSGSTAESVQYYQSSQILPILNNPAVCPSEIPDNGDDCPWQKRCRYYLLNDEGKAYDARNCDCGNDGFVCRVPLDPWYQAQGISKAPGLKQETKSQTP